VDQRSLDHVGGPNHVDGGRQGWLLSSQIDVTDCPDVDHHVVASYRICDGAGSRQVANNGLSLALVDLIESRDFPTLIGEIPSHVTTQKARGTGN
jgi:hypothetical protein